MLSFKAEDGSTPPEQVLSVYRYLGVVSLIVVGAGCLTLLGGLLLIGLSAIDKSRLLDYGITVPNNAELYDVGLVLIQVALLEYGMALVLFAICAGIRLRIQLVFYCLYIISAIQPRFWHNVPWTSYIKNVLSREFRDWFAKPAIT